MPGFFQCVPAPQYVPPTPTYRIQQTNLIDSYDVADPSCWSGSGTTLNNLGSGNNTIMNLYGGVDSTIDATNGWINFDGVNDYAKTGNSENWFDEDWSVGVWYRPTVASANEWILSLARSNFVGLLLYQVTTGNWRLRLRASSSDDQQLNFGSVVPNTWYYFGISYDVSASKIDVYIGTSSLTKTINAQSILNLAPFSFTSSYLELSNPSYECDASIGEVHTYKRFLTQADWEENYTNTKARYGY